MEVYRSGIADCAPTINILWCSIRGRRRPGKVFAGDLAPCKTEYSIREDLAAAESGVFYFTKTLKI
jgi:hypothetical protein